ncbi:Calx-beta domain-containing protein [Bacteroidales bacterium WCE2004]|nr:Calx-beta domain-containing protein [Bacteroidales bacterium WCE2004]
MMKNMKRIYSVVALLCGLLTFASCELNKNPEFNEADAFAEFEKTALAFDETAGEISVPVTVASLNGRNVTVSYGAVDGTAKEGVNYDLVDGSGVLTFTPETRTQYIKVKVYDPDVVYADGARVSGRYTGDLKFKLEFKSTGDVKASMESSCTVTIQDTDHPLSNILGNWTFTGVDHGEVVSWPCELKKDADDDHVVWFYDIAHYARARFDGWNASYYGVVSEDLTTITVPLGQESEYKYSNGESILLLAVDAGFEDLFDSGSVTATIEYDADGKVTGLTFDLDSTPAGKGAGLIGYIPGAGIVNYIYGPFTGEKK